MDQILKYRKTVVFFVLACSIIGFVLAACDSTAFVDINFDATEGVGNIVITGDQNQPAEPQDGSDGDTSMSQILLFGLVVALLLGTVAIVISLSRRPRPE